MEKSQNFLTQKRLRITSIISNPQMSYTIYTTNDFDRSFKKLKKKDNQLSQKVIDTLGTLSQTPFKNNLKTHKVYSRKHGATYSSRVTGDIRILWLFSNQKYTILALAVGGHSGKSKVY